MAGASPEHPWHWGCGRTWPAAGDVPRQDLASPQRSSASGATTGTAFPQALHHHYCCSLRAGTWFFISGQGHQARVRGAMGEWVTLSMVWPRTPGLYAPGSCSLPVTSPELVPGVRQAGLAPPYSPAPCPRAAGPEQQHSPGSLRANPPLLHSKLWFRLLQNTPTYSVLGPAWFLGGVPGCVVPWPVHPTSQPSPSNVPWSRSTQAAIHCRACMAALGVPSRTGSGGDVSPVPWATGPSSCAFAPGVEGCWMGGPRPGADTGVVVGGCCPMHWKRILLLNKRKHATSAQSPKILPEQSRGGAVPAQPGTSQLPRVKSRREGAAACSAPLCPPGETSIPWSHREVTWGPLG